METTTLAELAAAFRARTLPRDAWTHRAHLRVGAWHVHHHGPEAALSILRDGIRRLNESHGTPNSVTSGYHETVTVAYVRLIDAFLAAFRHDEPLEHRVDVLLDGPLAEKSVLLRFWSRDALMSAKARFAWVEPDVAPLGVPRDVLARVPE